jgi:hypothetical protein
MFWIKKSEIILDCFTNKKYIYEQAKINYATKFFPEWWKKMHKQTPSGNATIKHCVAFQDFYKKGIVIPSWFDFELTIFDKNNEQWYEWEASNHDVNTDNSHGTEQFKTFAEQNVKNMKIDSPWLCKTKEEIYWTWTQPTWNNKSFLGNLQLMPAVTNFKYQYETHINYMVLNKDNTVTYDIPPLTPLVIMHPLTEKNIKICHHLIDDDEFNSNLGKRHFILGRPLYKDSISRFRKNKNIANILNR